MTTNLVGTSLGAYRLAQEIGSGGLATVYKAYQPNLERWVAVKVLDYQDRESLLRFQREAQAIAQLRHRNIIIVYDYGQEQEWPYIAMEYIEGGTLEDRLFGQPLDWIKAVDLLLPITDALGYAHTQGIIHRDVKPSNILLPQEDWPLLADFGLVKLINSGDDDDDVEEITGPGTAMGTPSYLSPEQARGMPLDYRADIYSLGVLLYEMVTGRLPFTYENPSKLLLAHVNEPAPLPRRFNPACPVGLEQVILRMLHKSPAERYQDMAAVQVAFKEVLASPTVRPQFHSPPVPAPDTQIIAELATTPMDKNTPQPEPVLRKQAQLFLLEQKVSLPVPDQEQVIIGRTHRNIVADIDLGPYGAAEAGLSRHHARLTRQGDHWLIDDLGSLNGTFVNRVKVNPTALSTPLKDGDEIRCSQLSFIFLIS